MSGNNTFCFKDLPDVGLVGFDLCKDCLVSDSGGEGIILLKIFTSTTALVLCPLLAQGCEDPI